MSSSSKIQVVHLPIHPSMDQVQKSGVEAKPVKGAVPSASKSVTVDSSVDSKAGGDDDHEARLLHHHKHLHPCYSTGLTDDRRVKIWSFINLIVVTAYCSVCLLHLLIAAEQIQMGSGFLKLYKAFHGSECVPMVQRASTGLNFSIHLIYLAASVMFILAVFLCADMNAKVHLSVWYMHLSGVPFIAMLFRLPIAIESSHYCTYISHDTKVVYWVCNAAQFVITGVWVFFMHSVAHLYIHWLHMPIPPAQEQNVEGNLPSNTRMVIVNNLDHHHVVVSVSLTEGHLQERNLHDQLKPLPSAM